MNTRLIEEMLPLGSMVRLHEVQESELYLIIARAIAKGEDGAVIPRYRVVPHPHGNGRDQEMTTIHTGQIADLVFRGYADEQDDLFIESLFELMENAGKMPANPTSEQKNIVQPPQKDPMVLLRQDPFYKFRNKGEK